VLIVSGNLGAGIFLPTLDDAENPAGISLRGTLKWKGRAEGGGGGGYGSFILLWGNPCFLTMFASFPCSLGLSWCFYAVAERDVFDDNTISAVDGSLEVWNCSRFGVEAMLEDKRTEGLRKYRKGEENG